MAFFNNILNFLYPPKCPYCKNIITYGNECCAECNSKLERYGKIINLSEACISYNFDDNYNKNILCIAPFIYTGKVREAIINYKFHNKTSGINGLSRSIYNEIKDKYNNINFDVVTSIPINKFRKSQRGYNQSERLARMLAKQMKVPYNELLFHNKNNKLQHTLNAQERIENVKGAYKIIKGANIAKKTILLIDDIITTGSTLNEAASALLIGGAKFVYCATISYSII